jgi:hypothetical protein
VGCRSFAGEELHDLELWQEVEKRRSCLNRPNVDLEYLDVRQVLWGVRQVMNFGALRVVVESDCEEELHHQ